jgi:hypothetical protein
MKALVLSIVSVLVVCSSGIVWAQQPEGSEGIDAPEETTTNKTAAAPDAEGREEDEDAAHPARPDGDAEATGETTPHESAAIDPALLADENAARTVTNRYGMLALGAWALGNIGWATAGLLTNDEDPARAFHLTNAAWNLVNGTIAIFGYFGSIKESHAELDLLDTLAADHNAEKLYLVNGALDVAYMMGGGWLIAKGNLDQKDGLVGTGRSVILQGAFLLAFDATLFTLHWLRRKAFQKSIGR